MSAHHEDEYYCLNLPSYVVGHQEYGIRIAVQQEANARNEVLILCIQHEDQWDDEVISREVRHWGYVLSRRDSRPQGAPSVLGLVPAGTMEIVPM